MDVDADAEAEAAAEAAAEEEMRLDNLDPFNYQSPNRKKKRKSAKFKTNKRRLSSGAKSINTMDEYYKKVKTSATSPRNIIVDWESLN